jgi:hypothetical protein
VADLKRANLLRKWSTIPKAGWSLGYVSAVDSQGERSGIADAHRDNGKRFVVHTDEKFGTFLDLESEIRDVRRIP